MTVQRNEAALNILGRLACIKAHSLIGRFGFSQADRDDVCQELQIDCWLRLCKFDPAKSSLHTFLHGVMDHRVATLIESQHAARRDYRRCRSLNTFIVTDSGKYREFGETLSADDYIADFEKRRSSRERIELEIDVARVLSALPLELVAVAVLLMSVNTTAAARQLGLSRSTLYRRLALLRDAFQDAGLHSYLHRRTHQAGRKKPHVTGMFSGLAHMEEPA